MSHSILIVALLFAAVTSPSPFPAQKVNQASKAHAETSTNQPGTEEFPVFVKVVPTEDIKSEAAIEKRDEDRDGWDRAMAEATIGLAFITLALAVFTGGLWYQTYWLAKDTEMSSKRQAQDTRESLNIARESADAAKAIVATMDGNARRHSRAYLSVSPLKYFPQKREGDDPTQWERIRVYMNLRNNGFTPARAVKFYAWTVSMDYGRGEGIHIPAADLTMRGNATIPQNDGKIIPTEASSLWSNEEINGIRDASLPKKLCIYGRVEYKDVFGDDHFTNFCQWGVWNKEGDFATENAIRGNEAD